MLLRLPTDLREELKDPLGPIYTEVERLLNEAGTPLIAVGDVVTAHLRAGGRRPDLALVDGRTQRGPIDEAVARALEAPPDRPVPNPPATLTAELLEALADGLSASEPTTVHVDGEEDLAALPAVLAAPIDASVVYGQPGEGMVHVRITAERKRTVRKLLGRFEGDFERALSVLGVEDPDPFDGADT